MNPLEAMIRGVDMICAICGTPQSVGCTCWTKCKTPNCTWSYLTGTECPNCRKRADALAKRKR